ncbi:CSMD3 [Branchiostoma lanceolatum]|uniref:CSMD3 protein n=1 Tax=Branchiostoma lanceolatum TaxID=7740 RepID=A0A8J9ZTV2_BRALA|nr:CSMD3 [Branchiostoma lanceolatum]
MKTLTVTVTLVLLVVLLVPDTQGWFWSRRRRSCSRVDCAWGGFRDWSQCTATCGTQGTQERTRSISRGASCGGSACTGDSVERRACNRICYNDGQVTSSGCSCAEGFQGECCETAVTCPVVTNPENGFKRDRSNMHSYGDSVVFACNSGYEIAGTTTSRTCQADGTWSGEEIVCQRVTCPTAVNPTSGFRRDRALVHYYEDTVSFGCDAGYELRGSRTRTCQADRSWSGADPNCQRICCNSSVEIENGQVTALSDYCSGNVIEFSCNAGYELVGDFSSVCQDDKTWSGQLPTCQRISCGDPGHIRHATRNIEGTLYRDAVTFTCNTGFNLQGDQLIVCGSDGQWHGEPVCEPDGECSCDSLPTPAGGSVRCMTATHFDGTTTSNVQKAFLSCASPTIYPTTDDMYDCGASTGFLWQIRAYAHSRDGLETTYTLANVLDCQAQSEVTAALDVSGLLIRANTATDGEAVEDALRDSLAAQTTFCQAPCHVGDITFEVVSNLSRTRDVQLAEIHVTIGLYIVDNTGVEWTNSSIPLHISQQLTNNANTLRQLVQSGQVTMNVNGVQMSLEDNGVSTLVTTVGCPEGHEMKDGHCYTCPAGTYHDRAMNECVVCPFGYYTAEPGQTRGCNICPNGTTTYGLGATECHAYMDCYCMDGQHPCTHDPDNGWVCHCPVGYELQEDECIVACPSDATRHGEACYKMGTFRSLTYSLASQLCRFDGGELARVRDQATADFVKDLAGGSDTWIGLDDTTTEGEYRWLADSTTLGDFAPWAEGQPSDPFGMYDCVKLTAEGHFSAVPCNSFMQYVCEFQ